MRLRTITTDTESMRRSMAKLRIKSVLLYRLIQRDLSGSPGHHIAEDCFRRRWRRDYEFARDTLVAV